MHLLEFLFHTPKPTLKPVAMITIALGALVILAHPCRAQQEEERKPSFGPLVRFDPNAHPPKDLIAIYGDPTLGLTAEHSGLSRRIANTDKWLVGIDDSTGRPKAVAVMELDRTIGECRMRQILQLSEVFGVSPDGKFLLGHRDKNWECFSAADNRSLWTLEKDVMPMDGIFTADGKQVIVVHGLGKYSDEMSSAVSWYDAATGKRLHRVMLPGGCDPSMHSDDGGQLAISGSVLFVTRPSGSDSRVFMIPDGAGEAIPLKIDGLDSGGAPQVRVGGLRGELLAFYDPSTVRVRRLEGMRLVDLGGFSTPAPNNADATYPNNVRFSPDGKWMMTGRYGQSFVLPLSSPKFGKLITVPDGAHSGDFTADGKFFVKFDDGGGRALDVASWSSVNASEKREHPIHCCPITEAGFSISGDYLISSDLYKLMLWSKDGRLLAQLVSEREDKGLGVNMQSAIMPEGSRKIYAADGWNFLEWNLDDVDQRLSRKPLNVPRIVGKVVFNDRNRADGPAEMMEISMDSSGENLLTATRSEVRLRSMKTPDESKLLPTVKSMFMKPRSLKIVNSPLRVFLDISSELFELDPAAVKQPVLLNRPVGGYDVETATVFGVYDRAGEQDYVYSVPLGSGKLDRPAEETVKVPINWGLHGGGIVIGGKGSFVVVRGNSRTGSSSLIAVIDWHKKQVVWNQEVEWEPRSAVIAADGKRLVVGSSNKAVYVFDFEKITSGG